MEKQITGIDRMERCDLSPMMLGSEKMNGYTREIMLIQTEPDVWMPFYVLIPDGLGTGTENPCMITPPRPFKRR